MKRRLEGRSRRTTRNRGIPGQMESLERRVALSADGLSPDGSTVDQCDDPIFDDLAQIEVATVDPAVAVDRLVLIDDLEIPSDLVFDANTTTELDDNGNVVRVTSTGDSDGDGVNDWSNSDSYSYDDQGRMIGSVSEVDKDGDGVLDYRSTSVTQYDDNGNATSSEWTSDDGADGSIEYRSTTISVFDASGRLVHSVAEVDENGDGQADSRWTEDATYSQDGLSSIYVSESDTNADGTIDSRYISSTEVVGHVTTYTYESDADGDGVINWRSVDRYTYDAEGNFVSGEHELDENGDGVVDSTWVDDPSVMVDPDVIFYSTNSDGMPNDVPLDWIKREVTGGVEQTFDDTIVDETTIDIAVVLDGSEALSDDQVKSVEETSDDASSGVIMTLGGETAGDAELLTTTSVAAPVAGDTDGDGDVDFADVVRLALNYGKATDAAFSDGDFDGDADVDDDDFAILAAAFGLGS